MHATREQLKPISGEWWRFSRYVIRDGYIRPATDAELVRFDPWAFEPDTPGGRAYESLANLVRGGRDGVADLTPPLDPKTETALLAWCQRYGLLGVLLQRVDKVVLPTRMEVDGNQHFCIQDRYRRTPPGWQFVSTQKRSAGATLVTGEPAGVLLHPLDSLETKFETFEQTWATFFPTVSADRHESHLYPKPTSDEFWKVYQEPVQEFFDAATLLEQALTTLAKGRGTFANDAVGDGSTVDDYALAIHALNSYVGTVQWSLEAKGHAFVQRWASPSLFASLAMQVLQNIAGGQTVRTCLTCRELFVSSAYQARYCSSRCRRTMNQRTTRKNARAKSQQQATRGRQRTTTKARGAR